VHQLDNDVIKLLSHHTLQ